MTELANALLKAQRAMPAIHKDSTAEVVGKTKDGKPYKYSYGYLSLQSLLGIVLPVLNEAGLALAQMPGFNEAGRQILRTSLFHESGETLVYDSPLIATGNETPQAWGGAVTYARRYALTALLGIAADEDDDGREASAPKRIPAAKSPVAKSDNGLLASTSTVKRMWAIIGELADQRGVDDDQVSDALRSSLRVESLANLTKENADKALVILESWQKKVGAAA